MDYEIATEALPLNLQLNCTKNSSHKNFIKYEDFKVEDLPKDLRREDIYQYIKNIGLRVVRLTVQRDDGSAVYGTGVVYKAGVFYGILTNDHVVASETDVKNCTIDFFYHKEGQPLVQSKGEALMGCSGIQDKCLFTFSPVPVEIKQIEMLDNLDIFAMVTPIFDDGSNYTGIGVLYRKLGKWFVMVSTKGKPENKDVISCQILPLGDTSSGVRQKNVEAIEVSDPKVIVVEMADEEIPQSVQNSCCDKFRAPWPKGNSNFIPMIIAHPHGWPKMITLGKMLDVQHEGHLAYLHHTAETCPGSSGGLLITLGGDTSAYCEYCNTVGVHCQGETQFQYKGVVLENGNLNTTLLNNA